MTTFVGSPLYLQMLRWSADRDERMELAPFTDLRPSFDGDVGQQLGSCSNSHMFADDAKWARPLHRRPVSHWGGQWHVDESARCTSNESLS